MEMIVLADEIIAMIRYIIEGVSIDPNSLALDAIRRVKPGESYLTDDHTLDNWRAALFFPKLLSRERFESWERSGRPDMLSRLNKTARDILVRHQVPPLSDETEKEINAVLLERKTL